MTVLSKVHQLRLAVKNVKRMREIAGLMTRFGFRALLQQIGLSKFADWGSEDKASAAAPLPVRMRLLFENLGPTFIKLGQILSGRPDLVPKEFLEEFKLLQDKVQPISILEIKAVVEESLGRKLEEVFSSFDTEALATASIAQVHAARTLEGDDVVVKIKKPGVKKLIQQDLEILELIAQLIENSMPELKSFRPRQVVQEFKRALLNETDFTRELYNIQNYRNNFVTSDFLYIPKPYADLSSEDVLTMERIRGVKLSNIEAVRALGVDTRELLRKGMDSFFQSVMIDGLFHSDPHGGNIFVLPDGRMALVDFGSVGKLSDSSRRSIVSMFLALLTQDYEWLVQEYVQLSPAFEGTRTTTTLELLSQEIYNLFSPYHGRPLKSIPSGKLLMDASSIALKYRVILPNDLIMVFKSIMTLEGLARDLDPDFDLVGSGANYAKTVLKTLYKPEFVAKEILFASRDALQLARHLPRQIGEITRQIECGELKVNVHMDQINKLASAQIAGQGLLAQGVIAAASLLVATMLSTQLTLPVWLIATLWSVSLFFCTWTLLRVLRSSLSSS
jgi:ubiquinone biosynthesis protein